MAYIGQDTRQSMAVRTKYTAAGGETSVNVTYTAGQLSVFLNGVKLVDGDDYTATNGTSITGLSPALVADDIVDFIALDVFTVADTVSAGSGGSFGGTVNAVDILPTTDDTSDLGSPTKQWRNIYTGDLHLTNERGSWTVIEEEDYLTLRNNKTDKVYKLVMEEIE